MPYRYLFPSASSIAALSALAFFERNARIRLRILPPRCHWVHARMQF